MEQENFKNNNYNNKNNKKKNKTQSIDLNKKSIESMLKLLEAKNNQELRKANMNDFFNNDANLYNESKTLESTSDKIKSYRMQEEFGAKKFIKP